MNITTVMGLVIFAIIVFPWVVNAFADSTKYRFLFRNTIYSHTLDVYPARKAIYELAPVMRGKVYRPNYFFLSERKQYLVKSSIEFTELMNPNTARFKTKASTRRYVLLDDAGQELRSFDTEINFSRFSGKFFAPTFYIDWLDSGSSEAVAYERIHNQDLSMDEAAFSHSFRELHHQAEYIETVNLRAGREEKYESAVVFKIQGKWNILLSGLGDSRMSRQYNDENPKTAIWDQIYRVPSYRDPVSGNIVALPSSPPSMAIIPLETETAHDAWHKNMLGLGEISVEKYEKSDYLGVAYVRLKLDKSRFYFKVPDVEKATLLPFYNLGLRLFKLPESLRSKSSLIFMESTQGSHGSTYRAGLGVYVVRERLGENFPAANDLPAGIGETRYAQLPISLQQALLDIEHTTDLEIVSGTMPHWLPEIELLKNLTYLRIRAQLREIPDGIAALTKLKVLYVSSNHYLHRISPKISELKELQYFAASANCLPYFPAGLTALLALKEVDLGMNDFTEIPPDIDRLANLQIFALDSAKVTSFPDSMADMKQLYIRVGNSSTFHQRFPQKFQHLFVEKSRESTADGGK